MVIKDMMQRVLGVMVIFQALAPFLIVVVLVGSFIKLGLDIRSAVSSNWQKTEQHITTAGQHIKDIENEAKRLMGEVTEIKGAAKQLTGDIGRSLEPLRKALLGLQSSMRLVAGSIESVINGVVKAVNKLPGVKIRPLNIKRYFKIQAFSINLPEINLNISPDLGAIQELSVVAEDIATDAQASLIELKEAFIFWWSLIKLVFTFILIWVVLAVVGYFSRLWERIKQGWSLCIGAKVEGGLQLL